MHAFSPTARGLGLRRVAVAGLVALLAGPRGADALGAGLGGPSLRPAFATPVSQGPLFPRSLPGATCSRRFPSIGRVSMQSPDSVDNLPSWARELTIIGTGAGVGVTAGFTVTCLKLGINAIRETLYSGAPAEFMHTALGGFASPGFNPEVALFPLVGGNQTSCYQTQH